MNEKQENNQEKGVNIEKDTNKAIVDLQTTNGEKIEIISKKVIFSQETLLKVETMMPLYNLEAGVNKKSNEVFNYIIKKAVDYLFENEFKRKWFEKKN